jgi:hypothetical protein
MFAVRPSTALDAIDSKLPLNLTGRSPFAIVGRWSTFSISVAVLRLTGLLG